MRTFRSLAAAGLAIGLGCGQTRARTWVPVINLANPGGIAVGYFQGGSASGNFFQAGDYYIQISLTGIGSERFVPSPNFAIVIAGLTPLNPHQEITGYQPGFTSTPAPFVNTEPATITFMLSLGAAGSVLRRRRQSNHPA